MVEHILVLAQNGLNIDLHWPNYISHLSEYAQQTKLPREWKVPKFTKFSGETNGLTVEHVARYQAEACDRARRIDRSLKFKSIPPFSCRAI